MKKKILVLGMMLVLLLNMTGVVYAAQDPQVTLQNKNLTVTGDFDSFADVLPGTTAEETIVIQNKDAQNIDFYMKTTVSEDLAKAGVSGAAYTLTVTSGNEVVFEGNVGGEDGNLIDFNGMTVNEDLLVAAGLGRNQTKDIKVSLSLDGDSVGNEYQSSQGVIDFTFYATYRDPVTGRIERKVVTTSGSHSVNVVRNIQQIVRAVQTGDNAQILLWVVLAAVSAVLIIFLIRRRNRTEEEA